LRRTVAAIRRHQHSNIGRIRFNDQKSVRSSNFGTHHLLTWPRGIGVGLATRAVRFGYIAPPLRCLSTSGPRRADGAESPLDSIPPRPPPRSQFSPGPVPSSRPGAQRIYDAAKPDGLNIGQIIGNDMKDILRKADFRPPRPDLRLRPSTGRTVHLKNGIRRKDDFGQAAKSLERLCARNKIRVLQNLQRFHERPGLKKKRLRQSRWRVKFKTAFGAVIRRVQELKNQGW